MFAHMLNNLRAIDQWLDDAVSGEYKAQPLAQDWARITKVSEELGEAVNAFILYTGQNPRKQQSDSIHDTLNELADVACTAMLAIQHFTKDEAQTGAIMLDKVRAIYSRMVQAKRVQPSARAIAARDEWLARQPNFPRSLTNPLIRESDE